MTTFLRRYKENTIPKIFAVQQEKNTSELKEKISSEEDSSIESESSSEELIMATTHNSGVYTDEPKERMEETGETSTNRPQSQFFVNGKYVFTLDDIPFSKWPQRLQEFHDWMETQKLTRESNNETLIEFISRLTGLLRDWWHTLGPVDQTNFLVQQDFSEIIRVLHLCFLGNPDDAKTLKKRELFKRRYYSFDRKDLTKHLSIMTKLFYILGVNQGLKQVILASIPELLQNAVNRQLQHQRRNILNLTI